MVAVCVWHDSFHMRDMIKCYIAITLEKIPLRMKGADSHVSVCYLKDGKIHYETVAGKERVLRYAIDAVP